MTGFAELFTIQNLVALVTLTLLEVVLGIDNIIFVAILSTRLPPEQQARGRNLGMLLAIITRILLLLGINVILQLQEPLFNLLSKGFSGKDLILLAGGLFLIGKSTYEIHEKLESIEHQATIKPVAASFMSVMVQILIIDLVFSLDGIITAVGVSNNLWVMILAIVLSSIVMLIFAGTVSSFVERHPTMKILALAFLIMIGALLVIEGWNHAIVEEHSLKNYVYFAMTFSFVIELVNMRLRKQAAPVHLHNQPVLPTSQVARVMASQSTSTAGPTSANKGRKGRR
jgi:predicted tellurium resistance membrane protein TerC